jgi:hypothetical protein
MKFPTGSNYKNLMKFLYKNEFFGYYRFINENEISYRTTDYTFSKVSEGYLINIRFSIDDNNNIKSLKINEKFYLRVKKCLESIFSIHNEETLEEIYADLLGRVDRNTPPDKIDYFMKSIGANQIESEEVKDGTIYCNYKNINNCINIMNKKDIDNYTLKYKYEYPFLSIPWILSIKDEGIIFSWNFDKDQKLDHLGVS